jgi:hypothetical protein
LFGPCQLAAAVDMVFDPAAAAIAAGVVAAAAAAATVQGLRTGHRFRIGWHLRHL